MRHTPEPARQDPIQVVVCIKVAVAAEQWMVLRRNTTMHHIPRVGDNICADGWGYPFIGEGVRVDAVIWSLDSPEVFLWLSDDLKTWSEWPPDSNFLKDCFVGFTKW